jgi:phage FluMu protein Com
VARHTDSGDEFSSLLRNFVHDTKEPLEEVIKANEASDKKAKAQGVDWTKRHRLCVLLDAAQETLASIPNVVVAPWFLAELSATLMVVRKWRRTPFWQAIETALKEKDSYPHTIGLLHVAEHLEMDGYKANIVPEGDKPSPDLTIRATGGTQSEVAIECYQPAPMRGHLKPLTAKEAANIVEKSMKKARRQIGLRIPGIIVICGYNQSRENLRVLRHAIDERLSKTDRASLWGFWLMTLGVLFKREESTISFTPTRSAEFVLNPAYFGTVDFEAKVPTERPDLIKDQLSDLSTDMLLFGIPERRLKQASLPSSTRPKSPQKTVLKLIPEPDRLSRSVIHGTTNQVPPFFMGTGNVNYSCGKCGTLLAERIWSLSISDIVLQCPSCKSFNDFPSIAQSGYAAVLFTKGNYNFSKPVVLKPGRCVRGSFDQAT